MNTMDDLEILCHRDLVELCRLRTEQRDALASAMRVAIAEVQILRGRLAVTSIAKILRNALDELERTDANRTIV